ncbi:MAG: GTPase Era [Deltaproteobacteria bacterium]|nr:GTPase Era [Deltaproteobacteria bacterium]
MPISKNKDTHFKSGFVAIAGASNVGKSTLLNRILGQKISITSDKPQTTRHRILGIFNRPDAQFVFLDTPGIHQAKGKLHLKIVETALGAVADADLILFLCDVSITDSVSEKMILTTLKKQPRPVILALNKIDCIQKPLLLKIITKWADRFPFEAIIPISAKTGDQVETLLGALQKHLPQSPPFFPPETLTDLSERFIAAEIIREKIFRLTGQEIPYATAVTVDQFEEDRQGKLVRIFASIHLERNSQKGIIIGKKGVKLRTIGESARRDIEKMLGTRVFLKLFVRVQKNWSKDTKAIRNFGYE